MKYILIILMLSACTKYKITKIEKAGIKESIWDYIHVIPGCKPTDTCMTHYYELNGFEIIQLCPYYPKRNDEWLVY